MTAAAQVLRVYDKRAITAKVAAFPERTGFSVALAVHGQADLQQG